MHRWPGNVRELRTLVEASVALGEASASEGTALSQPLVTPAAVNELCSVRYRDARDAVLRQFKCDYLTAIIKRAGGNVSKAARESGMNRSHFSELLHRHKLR